MAKQKGVGQGTVTRVRRNPRERVDDVAITEASGLTLGTDGYPHPLETTNRGELRVTARPQGVILEDILYELRLMRKGMVLSELITPEKGD